MGEAEAAGGRGRFDDQAGAEGFSRTSRRGQLIQIRDLGDDQELEIAARRRDAVVRTWWAVSLSRAVRPIVSRMPWGIIRRQDRTSSGLLSLFLY
ncbi:MAG: hypothetical protein R2849_13665 [Thermomicrobiales bacterium]